MDHLQEAKKYSQIIIKNHVKYSLQRIIGQGIIHALIFIAEQLEKMTVMKYVKHIDERGHTYFQPECGERPKREGK